MSLIKAMVFKMWGNSHTDHQAASAEDAEFHKVNVVVGEGYYQNSVVILKSKAVGNIFIGENAGLNVTTAAENIFIGYNSGKFSTVGGYNTFIGGHTGYRNVSGTRNVFISYGAGYHITSGDRNVLIGFCAGYNTLSSDRNVFIGPAAGYYETGSYKLIIDVFPRASEADARIKSLIYGLYDALTANQLLRINGRLQLTEIRSGATQAASGAIANEVWKTNGHATLPDNVLMIGV